MKYKIGGRIKEFRKSRGMTQQELALTIGVSKGRVSNWEQGTNRPDADIIANICEALEVSPSELLDVHLGDMEYTDREKRIISAYREKKDLQKAVDILLGVD